MSITMQLLCQEHVGSSSCIFAKSLRRNAQQWKHFEAETLFQASFLIPNYLTLALLPFPRGVGQDHMHHPFVWRNAKSFYCFLPWEKAGLSFQCILKSILHEKTTNELLVSLYTLLRACTKQLCRWPCSLTEKVSGCRLFYPAQVFSVR